MHLGTPVKIEVWNTQGKYLKTIQRCLRGFTGIGYTVLYNNHRYRVQYKSECAENYEIMKRWIEV